MDDNWSSEVHTNKPKTLKLVPKKVNFNNEKRYKSNDTIKLFEKIKCASKTIIILVNFLNLKTI